MVGVPFLLRRCDAGPSGRIGWPLPCFRRNAEMIVGPKKKTRKSPVPAAPKRAEREVSEQVEGAWKLGEPGQHVLASGPMGEAIAQSRDERAHPAAVRAFDHRNVAATQGPRDFVSQFA